MYFGRKPVNFPEPAGAVKSISELKIGTIVYGVYGVWPIQSISSMAVTSEPCLFYDHPSYSDIHEGQAGLVVFDAQYSSFGNGSTMEFADSWNLDKLNGYNKNFLFKNLDDANRYREAVRDAWDREPELRQAIDDDIALEREWLDNAIDDYYNSGSEYDYDYEPPYHRQFDEG